VATPLRILFLCTGNACRSQMAEGWARALGGELVVVASAGIEAHGLNPRAVAVMAEAGVDIGDHRSTLVTPAMVAAADWVITLCGDAHDHCPVLPPGVEKRHWPLADPARATGDETAVMASFRASRDAIRARVAALLAELNQRDE